MIVNCLIVALIVLFFHVCTWEGMVFGFVSKSLSGIPDWLKKPLYDCPICMAIWWGPSIICCGILGKAWIVTNVWQLAIIVSAAAGINTVLIYAVDMAKTINKALDEYDCNCTKKLSQQDKSLERRKRIEQFKIIA